MSEKQEIFNLIGGQVKFRRSFYNPTSDAVWLAAFADAKKGGTILDVGIGTGGAALCLSARRPDLKITGIDISEKMIEECKLNTALNNSNIELITGNILNMKTARTFDSVITNPPYFIGTKARHDAHHNADIRAWTESCLRRVRPHGRIYMILDVIQADIAISALKDRKAGEINIIPLFGSKKTAERILLSARLGVKTGMTFHAGFSMNDERVLRYGASILDLI
ncbi:methyltransferase [Bacteroidia bacterium]|nr:methyltransferase [Bacteroidia bacterium]